MKLILASASPRRREILTTLGVDFTVVTADADETCDLTDPGGRVEAISVKKCHAVRDALAAEGRLDADTVILAVGFTPDAGLYHEMQDADEIYAIGDCRQFKNVHQAVWDAYEVANHL
jgi:pyruvate/2-oxoglutarate dehydrogenase complex dihydrolipoamide dehydrogenase (E3) component